MASNLGTVFVELSLDDKVYKQKLGDVLTSTTATAKGIETSWKALGTKSDAMFDQQRRAAENAYTLISAASGKASQEAVRAQQAAADKIKQINEQQFGKHTSLLDNLKQNYIAASIAIVAAWALVNKAVAYMDEGAKALQVESSFKIMSDSAGVNSEKLITSMKAATKETVDDSDLMQKAVKLMTLGYNPEQIERFSKVVITASQIAGTTATEAYEGLADAIANRMPKALVRMGGITREQMKVVTKAIEAGADSTALYELAMTNLELKQKMLQGTQDQATISLQRFHAQAKETGETIGKILIVGMREAYAVFQAFGVISLETSAAIYKVLAARNAFAAAVHFGDAAKQYKADADAYSAMADSDKATAESLRKLMIGNITGTADAGKKATKQEIDDSKLSIAAQMAKMQAVIDAKKAEGEASKETERATKQAIEATRKATYEIESVGDSQYRKDLDRIKSEADKYREAGVSKVVVANFVAAETELATRKSFEVNAADAKKMYDEQVKASEEYRKMVADEQAFSVDKHTAAMLKITANEENKLLAAEKLMDTGKISWDAYQAYLIEVQKNSTLATQELKRQEEEEGLKILETLGYSYKNEYEKLFEITVKSEADILEVKMKALNIYFNKAKWINEQLTKHKETESEKELGYIAAGLGASAQAFETLAGLYAEDSSQRKTFHDISMAFAIAEKAALAAKAVSAAVVAVAEQAGAGPYVGFVAMAAMAAAMAALLAQIGVAFSGGGGASAPAANTSTYTGVSTVLGASDQTGSASIANSYKLMEDTYQMTDTKLTDIYNALKDLNSSIIGLVTSIVRTGGITTGANLNISNTEIMANLNSYQTAFKNTMSGGLKVLFSSLGDWISVFGSNKIVENFINAIWGGGIERSINAQGIEIGDTVIKNLLAGVDISAKAYAHVKEIHSGGWFSSDWESGYTAYEALDKNITTMLTLVFKNIGTTLVEVAKGLGTDIQAVYNYVFSATTLNLQNMTSEEMSKALTDYFNSIADKATETLFGSIILQYQKLNEGLLETAVRLVNDKEIILSVLKMTGQAFTGTTINAIALSESLIELAGGLDKLTEAASTYYDKFFTDAEKQADLYTNLSTAMTAMNYTLPDARAGYRAIVEGLDLTTSAGQSAYVTLMALSEYADTYYSYLEDAATTAADKISDLVTELKSLSTTISDWLASLGISNLNPVLSEQSYKAQYSNLLTAAQAPSASTDAINDYLNYATTFLTYEKSYGTSGSYQAIYDAVVADVMRIQATNNTALSSYASGTDYVPETGLYQLHRGEIVSTKSDSIKTLGAAIGEYILNSNGGSNGGDIHVSVQIDGKEIGNVVAKQTKTNGDLQKSIRRLNS